MKRLLGYVVMCSVVLALAAVALAAQTEIKVKDGSKWRGDVTDTVEVHFMQQGVEVTMSGKLVKIDPLFIQFDGTFAGNPAKKTIYKSDIVSMKTTAAGDGSAANATPAGSSGVTKTSDSKGDANAASADPNAKQMGVFVLPLEGTVGETFRHEEIEEMGKYLDKNYGPGQILILLINSNGGSSLESQKIADVIFDIKKRHRVIAWIHKAISAGCQTAMCCNEMYFMTEGTAGSVTTWNPGTGQSIKGEELAAAMEDLARIAEAGGRSKYIAYAMKTNSALLSYDKDPVTGEVTWYNDLSGEFKLSGPDENLCFNSVNAKHSGFSDGTADTPEELGKLLNMPKWVELSDYGRKLAKNWQKTCEDAKDELPLIAQRLKYKNISTGDQVVILGTRISLLNEAIGWWTRCHNVCEMMGMPEKADLEREVAQLKKDVADIKKRR